MYTFCDDQHCGEVNHLKQKMWMDLVNYKYKLVFNQSI